MPFAQALPLLWLRAGISWLAGLMYEYCLLISKASYSVLLGTSMFKSSEFTESSAQSEAQANRIMDYYDFLFLLNGWKPPKPNAV